MQALTVVPGVAWCGGLLRTCSTRVSSRESRMTMSWKGGRLLGSSCQQSIIRCAHGHLPRQAGGVTVRQRPRATVGL